MSDQLELLEAFSDKCSLLRYSVPVEAVEALQHEGSKYSPEFEIGGVGWRLHLQHRTAPQTNEVFLAVHLQCLNPAGAYGHFRLTLCNKDPAAAKAKTFHCHFKKSGSAWGLHHFIQLDRLLNSEYGFIDERFEGRRVTRRIVIDVVLNVLEADPDGGYGLGTIPQSSKTFLPTPPSNSNAALGMKNPQQQQQFQQQQQDLSGMMVPGQNRGSSAAYVDPQAQGSRMGSQMPYAMQPQPQLYPPHVSPQQVPPQQQMMYMPHQAQHSPSVSSIQQQQQQLQLQQQQQQQQQTRGVGGEIIVQDPLSLLHVKAPLVYPFEHLEVLCDMWFDVNGLRIKAHRCVIAARMAVLIPDEMKPLAEGVTIAISDSLEVFTAFLRYVYTEDYPEQGVLRPESILDLYLLAARCEFFDLCGVCLKYVRPLLTAENILPIVLTKYSIGDEVLNALYLRILLDNYDVLIQDKTFEEIPGHLFRRLSLILREKERLPAVNIPATRNTLGRQLAALADSGDYADYEIRLGQDAYIPAHRYLLASRSVVYSHAFSPKGGNQREPNFDGPDNQFSYRAWQKFLASLYRRTLGETAKDLAAEDIALIFKMHSTLTLDGQLKREAEMAVTPQNALRVLIYAVKHSVTELRDRAMSFVSSNFSALVRNDPQAWDLIGELPQYAVVTLFRTVTEAH